MAVFLPALALAAGPIVKKVLVSLGFGVITYAGLSMIASQVVSAVQANYGAMGGAPLQLLNMIGAGDAMGIILGAITARATFAAVGKIGKIS